MDHFLHPGDVAAAVEPEEAGRVRAIVADEMEHAATLAVPLVAEAKSGESWYDAK